MPRFTSKTPHVRAKVMARKARQTLIEEQYLLRCISSTIEIAKRLKEDHGIEVTTRTVRKDVKRIQDRWSVAGQASDKMHQQRKRRAVKRYERLAAQAIAAFEESKKAEETVMTETGDSGKKGRKTRKGRHGDASLINAAIRALQQIDLIEGNHAPIESSVTMTHQGQAEQDAAKRRTKMTAVKESLYGKLGIGRIGEG